MRRWPTFVLVAALLLWGAPAPLEAQPSATPSPVAAIDRGKLAEFVDGLVAEAMRKDRIAGVSVAIVDSSGPLLIRSYGVQAPRRPATTDTLFPVQSISKTMVWIALMQLVEQSKVGMDDPINRYLPPALQVPAEGFHRPIRIRDLMSHTPGFEDSAFGILFVDKPKRLLPLDGWLERYRVHRVREPGEVVVYSNYGGALGGAIVAHVSGMSWQDYAEQKIIRPLGMDATFRQPYSAALAKANGLPEPMAPEMVARLTQGFHLVGGRLEPASREYTSDFPAGAMVATPGAMAAYMRALLDPEQMERAGVLKASTVLAMREPLVRGPAGFGDMRHGFGAQSLPGDLVGFGHNGGSTYQSANMTVVPSLGLGVFLASNTASGYDLAQRLRQAIVAQVFGARLPAPVYGAGSAAQARGYAGDYRNLQRPYFRTEHGIYDLLIDTVTVSARPNGDIEIGSLLGNSRRYVPLGDGVYREAAGSDRIAFRPLGAGRGLYEPFRDLTFERIGFLDGPAWGGLVMVLAALAAAITVVVALVDATRRRAVQGFQRYAAWSLGAAALAWLTGFVLFVAALSKSLGAADVNEINFWYPPTALVWACWTFAVAAALTLAALPGLAVLGPASRWSTWRKGLHAVATLVFALCAWQLWRLSFLGFSGW